VTRILITGVSGLLGINLALEAIKGYEVVGALHERPLHEPGFPTLQADLLAPNAIPRLLDEAKADWVINCVALASLDAAEQQPDLAQRLNAELPGRLAAEAARRGMRFLHVSTDAVFDGVKGNYDEEDAPAPLGVYGRTKRLSELAVKAAHPHVLILRPNFFGWSVSGQRSLAEFFYNNLSAGRPVPGFTDRIFCPLHVSELAAVMLEMLAKDNRGLYHTGSSDAMSKHDFGVELARRFSLDAALILTRTTDPSGAPRALDLSLRTGRLAKVLGRRLPNISEGIEILYQQFESGHRNRLRAMAADAEPVKG
jgi:dTDP-4-dehydrorhamnose reductase